MRHEPGRDRVDEHVDAGTDEMRVGAAGPEPLREQRPGAAVPRVEPGCVPTDDPADPRSEIGFGRGDNRVVVRVEQR
jgi:hypothetical protein